MKRKLVFIVNPASGKGMGHRFIPSIIEKMGSVPSAVRLGHENKYLYREYDLIYDIFVSGMPGVITEEVRAREQDGFNEFVAIGGDGTLNEVVNGIQNLGLSGSTVGILPAGSGNDYFRNFNSTEDDLLNAIVDNRYTYSDVGLVNTYKFINSCSFGIDSMVSKILENNRGKLPGSLGYLYAALKSLITYNPIQVRLRIDDEEIVKKVYLVSGSIGKFFGGGMKIAPKASISDGLLDLCIIGDMNRFKYLFEFNKIYKGTHLNLSSVSYLQTSSIYIESEEKIQHNLDGNMVSDGNAHIRIAPQQLKVFGRYEESV